MFYLDRKYYDPISIVNVLFEPGIRSYAGNEIQDVTKNVKTLKQASSVVLALPVAVPFSLRQRTRRKQNYPPSTPSHQNVR